MLSKPQRKVRVKMRHTPPTKADIDANRTAEPEGERLRHELEAWLEKNKIAGIMLDTVHHAITVRALPHLPPNIKPILTAWGSIYVRDEDRKGSNDY